MAICTIDKPNTKAGRDLEAHQEGKALRRVQSIELAGDGDLLRRS